MERRFDTGVIYGCTRYLTMRHTLNRLEVLEVPYYGLQLL